MTIATNGNLAGWEVAGGKRNVTKKMNGDATNNKSTKELASKIPKLENLPPLKPDSTLYDLIRDVSDSEEDADIKNNNIKPKPKQAAAKPAVNNQQASPKQVKKPQEPINLLASSMISNQQKKKPNSVQSSPNGKNAVSEFDTTLNNLRLDDFEKEYTYLVSLFPNSFLLVNQHLATFLNNKLNHLPDFDVAFYNEKELSYPVSKLEKRVHKFLSTQIAKLNKVDQEKLFEFCFAELFVESSKRESYHGYKLYLQVLSKQLPYLFMNNLQKYQDIINENKHRHQKCLIALWALGQAGIANVSSGIKVWFDCMLPLISVKSCTVFVASYLQNIFDLHNLTNKTTGNLLNNSKTSVVSFDQYIRFYDLLNDGFMIKSGNLNLPKESTLKLRTSFQLLRDCLMLDIQANGSQYLETLFQNINNEKTSRQAELVEFASLAILNNKDTMNKWRQIFSKYLLQTTILIEYLSQNFDRKFKSIKEISKTLYFFEEQTTSQLNRLNASSTTNSSSNKEGNKQQQASHFKKSQKSTSSLELDMNTKLNSLVKVLIKKHFRKSSILGMALRTLIILAVTIGVFFYWDINQNKSGYTNSISKELAKYGLLDQTVKLIDTVKQFGIRVSNLANYYVPLYYKKTSEVVVPLANQVVNVSREYSNLAWEKSGPYRNTAKLYFEQVSVYVEKNFPVFVKNLISVVELAINYATTMYNFALYYLQISVDFVGIQLLGWKKGEFEQIFLDAFKLALGFLTKLIQKVNNFLAQ